ncbi:DNA internalization-related competence protein ComEC/Rec2 [Bisgaard Taxon 45]
MKSPLLSMCIVIILSACSLLWLPEYLLICWRVTLFICSLLLVSMIMCVICGKVHWVSPLVLGLCCASLLGYIHDQARQALSHADAVAQLPRKVETEFKIIEVLQQKNAQIFVVSTQLQPQQAKQNIILQWQGQEKPQLGERWKGELRVRPISARLNIGGFDKQQWYFAKSITAYATVKRAVKISEASSWREKWLQEALKQTSTLDYQGLLLALAFGERAWLPATLWQTYQKTNTAHLIAISGLHIGLSMAIGYLFMRVIQFVLPLKWVTPTLPILAGLLFAGFYAQLAGFTVPTSRAFFALAVVFLLRLWRQCYGGWQLLLLVVALLLLANPLIVLSRSFWLSVSAVSALLIWYQIFPLSLLHWRGKSLTESPWRRWRWMISLLHLQLGLLWLFTPVQLLLFEGIALTSFIANMISVPLYSFVFVPLVLFALITQGAFSSWSMANAVAEYVTRFLMPFQSHWVALSQQQSLCLIAILAISFMLSVWYVYDFKKDTTKGYFYVPDFFHLDVTRQLNPRVKWKIYLMTIAISLYCFLRVLYTSVSSPIWRLDTLDIGQGLANLIVINGKGLLYDTGASWHGGSMAELEIVPYLKREGIELDWVILSHDDNDHVGGAETILKHYPQAKLMTASSQHYGKNDRTFCVAGKNWTWQHLTIKALSPKRNVTRAKNSDSCVLLISDGTYQVLLTGDADIAAEKQFVDKLGPLDVLQVGHHGSKTSTGYELLYQTRPKIALISSGRWNPWHFPHTQVIQRLQRYQVKMYNTAELGQIRLLFHNTHIEIQTARTDFSPWYSRLIGLQPK